MSLSYQELYYASTQQSLDTGADGFGVRTYSVGWPTAMIDRVKSRSVFLYESGNKPLAGTFELMENPSLVMEYPKTYRFFKEEINGQKYYIFSRTIFLGRDYGWYLKERSDSARSGNIFAHVLLFDANEFEKVPPSGIFSSVLQLFAPRDYTNNPENQELQRLLTNRFGPPVKIPTGNCTHCDQPVVMEPVNNLEKIVASVYSALEQKKKLIINQGDYDLETLIPNLMACLPNVVVRELSFVTNYHDFSLDTEYSILFLNDFYQRDIPQDNPFLMVCDLSGGIFPDNIGEGDFYKKVSELIQSGDFEAIQELNEGIDYMLASAGGNISFDMLYYGWVHLMTNEEHNYQYRLTTVIQEVKDYDLSISFKSRLEEFILKSFKEAIAAGLHTKVADTLRLLLEIRLEDNRRMGAKEAFTAYFFEEDHATILLQEGLSPQEAYQFLIIGNNINSIVDFMGKNELPFSAMEFFVQKFIQTLPQKEDTEKLMFSAVFNGRISSGFLKKLEESWGIKELFLFLEDFDFFIYMGEDLQLDFFREYTEKYLFDLAENEKSPIDFLARQIKKDTYFQRYLDSLIDYALEKDYSAKGKIDIFGFYIQLLEKQLKSFEDTEPLDKLLKDLLYRIPREEKLNDLFVEKIKELLSFIKAELNRPESESFSTKKETNLIFYGKVSAFLINVHRFRGNISKLTEIEVSFCSSKPVSCDHFIQYFLATIPVDNWKESTFCRLLVNYFLGHEDFKKLKFSIHGHDQIKIMSFIPIFYNHLLVEGSEENDLDRVLLARFNHRYIQTLWNSTVKSNDPIHQQVVLQKYIVKDNVAYFLNDLLKLDRPTCKKVIDFLNREEDMEKLVAYLIENINLDGFFTGLLKKLFLKKPKS